jgi:predicted metal-dependent phosphoesterase TrpH
MAVQFVDLHMHSPASDGFWTPDTLPAAAKELGIGVLALADHDEVAGVAPMTAACAAAGIRVIPAVEISTVFENVGYHLLLYNIDLWNPQIIDTFTHVRRYYHEMCRNALDELARRGKPLDPEKSPALRGDALKVYHLVAALVDQGYAENMTKAYELCNEVGARYGWTLPMEEALHLGHSAGGVGVIAHPGRAEPGFTTASAPVLDRMRAIGLDGIECFHSFHNAAAVAFYLTYAQAHDMLISSGSDSHGPGQSLRPLTAWPAAQCQALLERFGIAVADPVRT